MIVCLCKGISDSHIVEKVQQGAHKLQHISKENGLATQCGKCACYAKSVIQEELDKLNETAYELGSSL